jgi:hypothetical protein
MNDEQINQVYEEGRGHTHAKGLRAVYEAGAAAARVETEARLNPLSGPAKRKNVVSDVVVPR